jgi:hypothetical protein
MTKHAKFSPSSSDRWLNCPASIQMTADVPRSPSSIHANEGSVAHELAAHCLETGESPESHVGTIWYLEDKSFEMTIPDEMAVHIERYIEYIQELTTDGDDTCIEQAVGLNDYMPEGFGTADFIILSPSTRRIHVIDLKYGKGVKVFAHNNSQGQLYALGSLSTLAARPADYDGVSIHIVQPRLGHYDEFQISIEDLHSFGDYVKQRVDEALSPEPPFGPSEKGCRWCPVAAQCKPLAEHNLTVISNAFDDLDSALSEPDLIDQETLDIEQVAALLHIVPMIESWCKTINGFATDQLLHGNEVPGYKLVEGRSIRKWTAQGEQELKERLGLAAYQPVKVISPSQAEKLKVGEAKVKFKLDADWVFKPEGKPTMVPTSDKRKTLSFETFDNLN